MTAIATSLPPLSSLDSYIRAVHALPMLDEEREMALAARVANDGDRMAAQELALAHLRFVVKIARSYLGYGLPLADLVQEGNIGLLKAVSRFSPEGGARLASFAAYWIRAEIHEFVLRNWRIVKVATTKAQRKLFFRLRSLIAPETGGRGLSQGEAEEIAAKLKVSVAEVHEMRQRLNAHDVSVDAPVGEDGKGSYADLYLPAPRDSDPESALERESQDEFVKEAIRRGMATLPARSRDIVQARWGSESKSTLGELAEKYGVSVERIRQIEKKALLRLRSELGGLSACGGEEAQ